jgi:acetoin utilization deacetylase AcuC-like enzyme
MKIIFSPESVEFSKEDEYESPKRVKESYNLLKNKGFKFLKPEAANESDILSVHSKELLNAIKTCGKENSELLDCDLVRYDNIFYFASLSAGGAIKAMELCFKEPTFALIRPPGHHAGKIAEGFCFFNNMAIAVRNALETKKAKKVAILDLDLHHGNGTESVFLKDKRVLFISLHESPLYPGTGLINQDNCINYPLEYGTNEETYLEKLKDAIKKIKEFNPDLIGISAGFDTYKEDPLGNIKLEITSYEKIAKMIKSLNKPTFSILEGGYSRELPECIYSYIKGFV